MRGPRYLVVVAACALLWPASASAWTSRADLSDQSQFANQPASGTQTQGENASPAAAPGTIPAPLSAAAKPKSTIGAAVDPEAAARACAGRRAAGKRIATHDPTTIAQLTTCLLRTERGQLGLRFAPKRGLSAMLASALARFTSLSYLAQGQQSSATQAENTAAASMLRATCHANGSHDEWTFADIKPRATPVQLARLLASELQAQGAVARAPGAVFGVAARRGLLFEHGDRTGDSFGVIAITCG